MKKKKVFIIIGVVAVLGAGAYFGKGFLDSATTAPTALVMTENVKKDTIIDTVAAKGVVSLVDTELVYSNTMSEVEEVLVEKSDVVKQGDVLLRFTDKSRENIENQIRDARLALRVAELSLSDAQTPASETDIESARLSVNSAEQEITNMEISINDGKREIEIQNTKVADAKKVYDDSLTLFNAGAVSQETVDANEKAVTDLEDALIILEGNLSKNEMALEALRENYSYREKVYTETQEKTSSPTARNTIAQRQISVEQARITISDLEKELADFQHELVAPIDGTITNVDISKGELASTERALFEISDVENYIVNVDVSERHAAKMALDQDVEIGGAVLGDEVVFGKVTKISSIAEEKQTANGAEIVIPVEITVSESENSGILKPGFSLEATITTEVKEDVVVVPILSTMKDSEGNTYVFVVKEDNTLEKRIVELGLYADMTVEVTGINEGETIVSQPTLDMVEGTAIEQQNIDEAPAEETTGETTGETTEETAEETEGETEGGEGE